MVGHTGVWSAVVKACETVDDTTQRVVSAAMDHGYTCLVTADHGNADRMLNPNGTPHTAHTTALVPLMLFMPTGDPTEIELHPGSLADLAPTILDLMDIDQPKEMTGKSLVNPV